MPANEFDQSRNQIAQRDPLVTYATRLTSTAPAAIAVVELDGPNAVAIVQKCWSPNQGTSKLAIGRIRYGTFLAGSQESIVVCRTAEDRVELQCHGGEYAASAVLRRLVELGAIERTADSWVRHRCNDLFCAEATADLLAARTQRTAAILLGQSRGALSRAMKQIESWIAQGDLEPASASIDRLLANARVGMHLIEPWKVVLAGPPNVGKSSLLNRLLGYTRAIVHESAGTTRDLLREHSSVDGWPVILTDSAGIRGSDDSIEAAGIAQTMAAVQAADCVLLLVDSGQGWTEMHDALLREIRGTCVPVVSKSDLCNDSHQNGARPVATLNTIPNPIRDRALMVSSKSGDGIDALLERISRELVPNPPSPNDAIPFRPRHVQLLKQYKRS